MSTQNLRLLAFLASALFLIPGNATAAPLITEFLAANTTGLADEDGERPDWIEIHNPDGTAIDLGGYHLTDDPAIPTRWTFPQGAIIQPGGYLIVFASGKDRTNPAATLHTNFSLEQNGEYLAFNAPGGAPHLTEFAAPFQTQSDNVSYGLVSTTGTPTYSYFSAPTPGAANNTANAQAEPVQFSLSSRTFNQGTTLTVSLSVLSSTATIRYTTDRSVPTASSPLWNGTPIPVTANTRIRARAFEPGRPDGPVRSETYFRIDAAAQTFTSPLPIIVTTTWGSTPASDVTTPAHIMLFAPKAIDGLARMTNLPDISTPCSLERRGSSTAGDPKYAMTLEFWDESNNDRNFNVLGMPSESDWILFTSYSFDRTNMHNDLIYRLSNEAGRYAVRTKYVEHFHNTTTTFDGIEGAVTGNVDYFGVYSFMEKIKHGDKRVDIEDLTTLDNAVPAVQGGYIFKADRLDSTDSGLRPNPGQTFGGIGTMGPGADILAWVDPKQYSPDPTLVVTTAQANYLRQYIVDAWGTLNGANFMDPVNGYAKWWDVGSVIDHHILNVAAKNVDAMRLSAFWHKKRFGKLTAGPIWDFDRAEGSTDGRDLLPTTWRGDNGDLGTDFFHYPWYNEMFKDPNFWVAWIDRYNELRKGVLSTAHVHAVIDEFANQMDPNNAPNTPAKRSGSRWLGFRGASGSTPGTDGTYRGEIAWLKNWWASRLTFMDNQFTRPAVPNIAAGPVPSGTNITLSSPSQSTPGVKIYYTLDGTDPRARATVPDPPSGGYVDLATILPINNTVRAIVPTSASVGGPTGVEWRGADLNANGDNLDDFADSGWFTNSPGAINGVGYDDSTAGAVDYQPYFSVRWNTSIVPVSPANATNTMRAGTLPGNQSCYIRWPFTVSAADYASITTPGNRLVLRIRFDDGFVAWINGTELNNNTTSIVRFNAPATNTLTYASGATTTHDDAASIVFVEYDLTPFISAIHAGNNVLAIHGLNSGTGSSDFLCNPTIVVQTGPPPYAPSISPSATQYTGPITINTPTQIFVRTVNPIRPSDPPTQSGGGTGAVPNGSSWSASTLLYYFPDSTTASQANIQISEVNYHPPSPTAAEIAAGYDKSNDFEFVRLTNMGATPVDLTGIFFSNGLEFTAVPGLQNYLPGGASVVVVENIAAFQSRYGTSFTILGQFSGELDDGGEHIVLNDKNGAVISDFIYDDTSPWPASADGERSLLYIGGNQSQATSWRASLDPGGSGVTNYNTFKQRYFNGTSIPAALQAPDKDPDGDGLVNLVELALALNPTKPDAPSFTNPLVSIRRRPAAGTNLTYSFEVSSDLINWSSGGASSVTPNADGTETAVFVPPPVPTGIYVRMKVSTP